MLSTLGLKSLAARSNASRAQIRLASTLVLSDPLTADGAAPPATQSAVTAAAQLGGDAIELLVVGDTPPSQVPVGVAKVYHASTASNAVSETIAATLQSVVENKGSYDYVVGTSSKFGSTVIPRAAALLGVSPVTDIIQVIESDTYVRPMYAGNALAKVQAKDAQKVLSFRPTSFDKAPLEDAGAIESVDATVFDKAQWHSENVSKSDRPDLGSANVVISGGRGMKSGDNFPILEALADKLGGAVGASRAAVDAGFVPNDLQVGQTGKVVAPDLYIAVGISGAIQHLSGMKDSKTIVAINKDPEAPIFQVADYGLVADLFEAVPEMTEKV
ncbi:flavoprotein subunit alpha, mitochondrial [Seminavis robusta]|uniref:Electron transfer flavoprotein subunit alpha n=1 Tax=Seminavis robusta TaxID=568900 RepID=A0A9N8DIQ5_9STRA|nr:flavoprotein subunit alpha, mitochondrial [Seminavis robusta]|eukprot:Sro164_g073430.1 flavoprotein subunit alpha, mitochondrial (330) ;mRNA; r:1183-2427